MSTRNPNTGWGRVLAVLDVLDGLRSAVSAVEARRKPSPRALRQLGIDGTAFDDVRL